VFEASVIYQAKHNLHTVICDLSSCTIFLNIISSMAGFLEERDRERERNVRFEYLYDFVRNITFKEYRF
jgi:hypothetical protein